MAGFNYTFGGMLVEPAQLSYLAFNFPIASTTPNQLQMNWPVSFIDSLYIMADILDITTSAGGQSLVLPPANQVSNGQQVLINNLGASNLTIYLNDAVTVLLVIPAGTSWLIYLTNNTTTNIIGPTTYYTGTWRTVPFAGGLAGVVTSVNATSSSNNLVIGGVPITSNGTITFALANDLLALSTFGAGTGYPARTAANTWALRTFAPVNANIAITNPAGIAGNTTIGLNNILVGLTSIGVGNLSLAGNTISATNGNGSIILSPQGTGSVNLVNSTSTNAIPLRWYNAAGTFYDAFQAPALIQNNTWTLPLVDGVAGNVLITDGAGTLSFGNAFPASPTIPGRNIIINGDFELWQRGTTFAVTNGTTNYGPDRWQMYISIGGVTNATYSQQAGATSGRFFFRIQRNAADAGIDGISISSSCTRDMCIGTAGNQLTISFTARAGANFSAAASTLHARIWTGTGNTDISYISGYTGQVLFNDSPIVLTNNFVRYTVTTAALPATVTQFALAFVYVPTGVAGAADYFDIYDIQTEISAVVSPFDRQPLAVSIPRCQYFYSKSFGLTVTPAQNVGINTGEYLTHSTTAGANLWGADAYNFGIQMRIAPTITLFNPAAANAQMRDETFGGDFTGTTSYNITPQAFSLAGTANAGTIVSGAIGIHWTADSELY